ncbi:PRKR-interacting protein 1 homolog isoform X2 [Lingula anatina]|uniref:PRKR-interacting protein 1 homolog isoform X2 n=1 Tax=Lingula anatina TaxID=7574 RepID=A0A1S3JUA6_LINAN|nr:PRKR-interacting protein 1 homolog isoform X2 [Lingula anatina]|eukprot:XP_013413955.1 PRKR-interacting protein 1 homolog isoform X2 [Lingula anatina]
MATEETTNVPGKTVVVPKTAADLQRMKLEKLMSNPEKEAFIPSRPKEYTPKAPVEFVRNVWGSSAGAGSGEFHVYRGTRRREYARQKFMTEKTEKEKEDAEYHRKLEANKQAAESKTAKKRAKRLKKKQKQKAKKPKQNDENKESESDSENDDEGQEGLNAGEQSQIEDNQQEKVINSDHNKSPDNEGR